jgi:hypothetical protein
MNAPCTKPTGSPILPGRCGNCGWPLATHSEGSDRVKSPKEIAERLSETFDPGGTINYDTDTWATDHATAIDDARALLEDPLTGDINAEALAILSTHPSAPDLKTWTDLLAHQVEELRALDDDADQDFDEPARQVRDRLVKIAGMAVAFTELIDRRVGAVRIPDIDIAGDFVDFGAGVTATLHGSERVIPGPPSPPKRARGRKR